MQNNHTINAAEYEDHVEQERADRAMRVRRFIAEHEEKEIDEFFDAIRDMIDLREHVEQVSLSRYFKGVHDIFYDVEEKLREQ